MQAIGIHTRRRVVAALLAGAVTSSGGSAFAASDHGHEEHAEPVPVGAELAERCADYREELEFTRAQLSKQNVLGRWDYVRTEHRKREKFVNDHCSGAAPHGDGHADEHSDDHAATQHDDQHG